MDFWRESYRRCIQASFCTNIDTVTLVIVIEIIKDPAISQNHDHFTIMQYNCAVCGDTSKQPLSTCLKCSRPCHSKCLGKRKGGECDICRKAKQQQPQKEQLPPTFNKSTTADTTPGSQETSTLPFEKAEKGKSSSSKITGKTKPSSLHITCLKCQRLCHPKG